MSQTILLLTFIDKNKNSQTTSNNQSKPKIWMVGWTWYEWTQTYSKQKHWKCFVSDVSATQIKMMKSSSMKSLVGIHGEFHTTTQKYRLLPSTITTKGAPTSYKWGHGPVSRVISYNPSYSLIRPSKRPHLVNLHLSNKIRQTFESQIAKWIGWRRLSLLAPRFLSQEAQALGTKNHVHHPKWDSTDNLPATIYGKTGQAKSRANVGKCLHLMFRPELIRHFGEGFPHWSVSSVCEAPSLITSSFFPQQASRQLKLLREIETTLLWVHFFSQWSTCQTSKNVSKSLGLVAQTAPNWEVGW